MLAKNNHLKNVFAGSLNQLIKSEDNAITVCLFVDVVWNFQGKLMLSLLRKKINFGPPTNLERCFKGQNFDRQFDNGDIAAEQPNTEIMAQEKESMLDRQLYHNAQNTRYFIFFCRKQSVKTVQHSILCLEWKSPNLRKI